MVWSCYSGLFFKRAIIATLKFFWKSLHFRETVGVDFLGFLGFLSKKMTLTSLMDALRFPILRVP